MARHAPYCQPLRSRRKAVGQHPPGTGFQNWQQATGYDGIGLIKMQRQVNWPCNRRATCSISSISRTRTPCPATTRSFPLR